MEDNFGNLLNEVTQPAEKSNSEQIVYIDIGELESNPRNFYGLRDVDALAGLIAVSHLIEPLTVIKKGEGKYRIISGHRRKAAVEKLLEEGTYTERKLPCIVKTLGKISIEQENGETIEFDEDAVEMLTLIASNRGQREERTVDEKLQEIKSLEVFAKAIFHQKYRGVRGRFRNFFAEEILNISKSQLQRINAMENLTDKVKQAVDEKKISETAAMAMSNMTAEEQDACLEKITSGEIKGTVQDIQNLKSSKDMAGEPSIENLDDDVSVDESATEMVSEEVESASVDNSAEVATIEESKAKLTYPKNLIPETETTGQEKVFLPKIIDVPEQLQRDCRDYLSTKNLRKIYARMMKVEVTKMMVEAVYQSLSSEEKEFVIMRYQKKKQLVAISLALNISVAQLVIHHHAILEKISEFMLYELSEEDIFKRQKIVSMIKLLERIIEFAEKYDSAREFINVGWLEAIEERHDRYFQMLCEIDKELNENDVSARKEIILAKMQSPYEKIEVLAERCNVDKSIISRHLKSFVGEMRKYLE